MSLAENSRRYGLDALLVRNATSHGCRGHTGHEASFGPRANNSDGRTPSVCDLVAWIMRLTGESEELSAEMQQRTAPVATWKPFLANFTMSAPAMTSRIFLLVSNSTLAGRVSAHPAAFGDRPLLEPAHRRVPK